MVVLKKTRDELQAKGYTVEVLEPDHEHPTTHSLTLSHATHHIAFEFQHTLTGRSDDQKLTVHNRVTVSGHPRGSSVRHSSLPWARSLGFGINHVVADLPEIGEFLISNELILATKDHFAIHVELRPKSSTQEFEPKEKRVLLNLGTQVIRGGEEVVIRDGIGGGEGTGGSALERGLEARAAWRRKYGPGGMLAGDGQWRYGEGEGGGAGAIGGGQPGGELPSAHAASP